MEKKPQCRVIVPDRAHQMLAVHVRFLAQNNPVAARKVKNVLIDAIRSLSRVPGRFPFLDANFLPLNKYHKMYIGKWYLILYQIKDQTVYVDYVIDCRQDYGWLAK
jgi:plasmid stabilization system protein ParE